MKYVFSFLMAVLAVLALQAHAFTDFHGLNPNFQRTELPDGRIHLSHDVHHVFPDSQTHFTAKYTAIHDKKWHFVEMHHHVAWDEQVDCGAGTHELFVRQPSAELLAQLSKQQFEHTVVTAHGDHHCGEEGLFRQVHGVTHHKESDTLKLHTQQLKYEHVFDDLDMTVDTNHLESNEDEHDEVEQPYLENTAEEDRLEEEHARRMNTQFWKKIKRAVKRVVKKVKKVVRTVVKAVTEPLRIMKALFTGTYSKSVHKRLGRLSYNKNVAKSFSKWNFNGDAKLAASANAGAGIRFDLRIKSFRLELMQAYYYGYFDAGIRASFNSRIKKDVSAKKTIVTINIATITFSIGPVPVIIKLSAPISAGYDLEIDGQLNLNLLLAASGSIKQGLKLTRSRGFQVINEKRFSKTRDFSPRLFRYQVGLTAYVLVQFKANINFIGNVIAGLQIGGEALLQSNSRCYTQLQINLQPIITAGASIQIKILGRSIVNKNWGPKALVSWKIPLVNFCIPRRRRGRRYDHGMELMDSIPTGVETVTTTSLTSNFTGTTWYGKSHCQRSLGYTYTSYSVQFLEGDYDNQTQMIVTAAQNVSIAENGTYQMSNLQQTYYMDEEIVAGMHATLRHYQETNETEYITETNDGVEPAIASTIDFRVGLADTQDITISSPMLCGTVSLAAAQMNNDNTTFQVFSEGLGAPETFLDKVKAYAIYSPILGVLVVLIVVAAVVIKKKQGRRSDGFDKVEASHVEFTAPIQEEGPATGHSASGVDHSSAIDAL